MTRCVRSRVLALLLALSAWSASRWAQDVLPVPPLSGARRSTRPARSIRRAARARSSASSPRSRPEAGPQIVGADGARPRSPRTSRAYAQRVADSLEDRPPRRSATALLLRGRQERPARAHRGRPRRSKARSPTWRRARSSTETITPALQAPATSPAASSAGVDQLISAHRRRDRCRRREPRGPAARRRGFEFDDWLILLFVRACR
ncbi:MAG: hypothetical protein MZV49_17215 [Rhodopseudomonas palustris]|nr:hypothetical protein [Rhodopseudomonas palustris]